MSGILHYLCGGIGRIAKYLCEVMGWPWSKKKDQVDIDFVTDVTVEQSCMEFCLDVGTVIIHYHGTADDSMIKDERKKLISALESGEIGDLQKALATASKIKDHAEIREVYTDASTRMGEEESKAKAENKPLPNKWVSTDGDNDTEHIKVLSVAHPHAILDDLSYKLCKDRKAGRQ